MRLALIYLSTASAAVVLSGCSWLGNATGYKNPFAKQKTANHQGYHPHMAAQHAAARCQIFSPQQPIPPGCRPEQVTLATGPQGGFPQQPQYGQPQYASGAYGTAAAQAGQMAAHHRTGPKLKKPRLRGALSLGVEKSVSGNLIDYNKFTALNPTDGYNPQDYNESFIEGSQAAGLITTRTYTANTQNTTGSIFDDNTFDRANTPSISFDDAYSTPATVQAGMEYIVNDRFTVFANGGYTHAEGQNGKVASIDASLYRQTAGTQFDPVLDGDGNPIAGSYAATPLPTTVTEIVNQEIAQFDYDFTDMERYNLEVGARHYFNPLVKSEGFRTLTPFVGASVGASHYNAVDIGITQRQAIYSQAFEAGAVRPEDYYTVATAPQRVRLYDSQWIPQGQLNVGAEWQVTPGMALALESGVRIEGAREYSDFVDPTTGTTISGRKGDTNVSIPLTLRGSVNF